MDNIIFYLKEHWTLNNTKFNPKINVNGSEKVVPWSWHRPILDFINFVSFNPVVYQVWHYDFEKNIAGYEYKSAQREGNAYVTHYPW